MTDGKLDIVVTYDYGFVNGGAAKVAIAGALGLAARGHRVAYFAPVGPADPRLAAGGVKTVVLDQPDLLGDANALSAAVRGIWNRKAAAALRRLLDGHDPKTTVIYQHGWSKAMSPACQQAIAASGIPTLYHMHEYFAACPNGAFFDYPAGENCQRRPMSFACITANCDARAYRHKLFRVVRQAALNGPGRFSRNLKHRVAISDLQKRVLSPWLPPPESEVYAPNPIDVEDQGPAAIADDAPFLFVGRFSREKGADLAAAAAHDAGAPIAFVGDGELGPILRQCAPTAEFTGWLTPEAVSARMRQARALVFPSIWYECQPLTVLEALAQGVPVIVSDNCAGVEYVADGETGLHVASQSVDALAAAMRTLMATDVARRMGAAAHRRYWKRPHTIERHLDAVEPALRRANGRVALGITDN